MTATTLTLLADLIVSVHLAYVLFVVVGLALVWLGVWRRWDWVRRPGFRLAHLLCTVIVPLEALSDVTCPMTVWERVLRARAGQLPEEISFVGRIVRDVLFYDVSDQVLTRCYVVFALLVLGTLVLVPIRRRAALDSSSSVPAPSSSSSSFPGRGDSPRSAPDSAAP